MDWIPTKVRRPTSEDGPMANENKVQVEVRKVVNGVESAERRNYFVASKPGAFDDEDLLYVEAWRPLPTDQPAQPYPPRRRNRF